MIYPQRNNRRRQRKTRTTAIVVGSFFVIAVVLNMWEPQFFSPMVQAAGRPFMEARGGVFGSIGSVWNYFYTKGQLAHENEQLKSKLALYNALERERDYYKADNEALSKIVGRVEDKKDFTVARILAKPNFSPYDTVLIDAGQDQGIKTGDYMYAIGDTVLGEVSTVNQKSAVVILFSTAERETPILIGTTSIPAIAMGKGAGNFEIKLPRNTGVKEGDSVIMASSTTKILGTVEVIQASPTDTFERALFKNPVDIETLSYVIIEKK